MLSLTRVATSFFVLMKSSEQNHNHLFCLFLSKDDLRNTSQTFHFFVFAFLYFQIRCQHRHWIVKLNLKISFEIPNKCNYITLAVNKIWYGREGECVALLQLSTSSIQTNAHFPSLSDKWPSNYRHIPILFIYWSWSLSASSTVWNKLYCHNL